MSRLISHPDRLFLLVAIPFGLLFTFLTPPFGGGDESFHYQRTAEIAYLHILDKQSEVPAGIVAFINSGRVHYLKLKPPADAPTEVTTPAEIPLDAGHTGTLTMNIFTVHNPITFLPQAVAFRLAAEAGARPFVLLYISRLTGLVAGLLLTWLAIRIMPSHKYLLAGFALLPTIMFFRSYLHTDAITNGMAFLFIALCFRAIIDEKPIATKESFQLTLSALLIASCKGAYLPLALLVLAIPHSRFGSLKRQLKVVATIILTAFIAGFGWMYLVKMFFFTGYSYQTYGGIPVPDEQLSFILHQPFTYVSVVLKTLFTTPFFPALFQGVMAQMGYGNIVLSDWAYGMLFFLLASVAALDISARSVSYSKPAHTLALTLFIACFGLALTLLYIQWTDVQAPIIKGFQGRYLIPILPLLFIFVRPAKEATKSLAGLSVLALGLLGLSVASWSLITTFYS